MKSNKTVVIFLIKFFGAYALLFAIYSFYLSKNQQTGNYFACAPVTKNVAVQTQFVLNALGYEAEIEQHLSELTIKLFLNKQYVARIFEGCNAVSIIILFIAFIIAFAGKFKTTLLYILFGSLIIYVVNIVRIALISIAIYEYPEYEKLLHDAVFPAIIYGITFLLWFVWIKKFSMSKK